MNKLILSFLFAIVVVIGIALPSQAQIELNSDGNVAIKTASVDNERGLNIECNTAANCGGTGYSYGLYTIGAGSYNAHGIYGIGKNGYGGYGVRGHATGNNYSYGVRGSASGSTETWGGYFTQGIYVSGGITQSSDERLKTNIRPLAEENISAKILQLEPLRYEFLSGEELSQRGLPASYADEGEHFGLSAQELQKVFPELVSDVAHILDMEDGNMNETPETVTTKAINYQELTVLLLAAVQELKAEVETLKAQLNEER